MGLLDGFNKLVGNAGHAIGGAVQGAEHALGFNPQQGQAPNPQLLNQINQATGFNPQIPQPPRNSMQRPNFGNSPYNPVTGGGAPIQPPISLDELLPAYTYNLPQGRPQQFPQGLVDKINRGTGFPNGIDPSIFGYPADNTGLIPQINRATGFNPSIRPPQPFNQPLVDRINQATGFPNGIDPSIFGYQEDQTSASPFQR